jgi:predicted Zn finger-like uncharacterized protein
VKLYGGTRVKFLCEQCKAKYQIADEKAAGKTVRMKCRKCGYLIEVRAAVTETSAAGAGSMLPEPKAHSSSRPPGSAFAGQAAGSPGAPPAAPRAPQKPGPPRANPLATSLASAKPPAKAPERSTTGALAGAFKSTVQRDEESSAPFDMADLSPSDEWYVAINGVPVGPIRIGEVRRKAALGAVTEDSLCWQEGMDEWRALRSFPELVAIVREAFSSGRSSLPPPPAGEPARLSAPPPAQRPAAEGRDRPVKPASPAGPPRAAARATPPAPAARSNVVPITSRLATAEKLEEATDDMTRPYTGPPITPDGPSREAAPAARELPVSALAGQAVPDPFASPPKTSAPAAMAPAAGQAVMTPLSLTPEAALAAAQAALPQRKQTNWAAIAMVAAAVAFGITTPIALFVGRAPAPAPVVVQVPANPAQPTASAASVATAAAPVESTAVPETTATATPGRGPVAMGGPPRPGATSNAAAAAAPAHGPLDLHGLTGNSVTPTDDQGDNGSKAPGQCFSSGQVTQVIGLHQPGIRRACWERNPTTKPTVNVSVSLTIGPDGSPQSVSANADESSVAKCVENDVRSWRFPAMGCSQQTSFSFHFVRQ